ncbi:hypothetical protein D3C76_518950 [compost metagenome]
MTPHVDPRLDPGVLQVLISHCLPTPAQGHQVGGTLTPAQRLTSVRAVALARPTLLRCLGVVTLEILLGVTLDAVTLPLTEHQVQVWLLAAVCCRGNVDRPLVGVAVANLLLDPLAGQRDPLLGVHLSRQGNLHLSVGCTVRPLEGVRRLPERLRLTCRPVRHVAALGCFQPFASFQPISILPFPSDVGSMRPGLAGLAYFHAESSNRHALFSAFALASACGRHVRFSGTEKQLSAPSNSWKDTAVRASPPESR